MTKEDLQQYCKDNGIPCAAVGAFRVMDLTQLPEHMRENFDERGVFKTPAEVASDPEPEVLGDDLISDDLTEDFPGFAALSDAGYVSKSEVAVLSDDDLDSIEGIGPATIEKIREALGGGK
jgi:hypothetical protein